MKNNQWVEHPSTMNPGMSYFIHKLKRHVVAFNRQRGLWVILHRNANGMEFSIGQPTAQDAIYVADAMFKKIPVNWT